VRRKLMLKEKKIIELGCGTAIIGVMASKMGAEYILMTDYHDRVIENAWYNVRLNKCDLVKTHVEKLDWRDISQKKKEGNYEKLKKYEILLAADVML